MQLNSKHQDTLKDVFHNPVKASIQWSDIENMLIALGATLSQGNGSRIRIELNRVRATFHRPHLRKETDKGAVKSMRRFLITAGVIP